MKTLQIPFTLLCVLAISALSAHVTHASQLATAKVISVEGTVTKHTTGDIKLNGLERQLKVGDILSEGDRLSSSAGSKAILVFSNGSEITISENTNVKLTELKQEPYNSSQTYEQLQADPSKSQTLLELDYGQLDGHVKKLSGTSSFMIKTSLGTAAIRGTRFSVSFTFSSGNLSLSINNLDGLVDFISQTTTTAEGEYVFDSGADITTTPIPPKGEASLDVSQENPVFNQVVGALATLPGVDVEVSPDGNITVTVDVPPVTNPNVDDPLPAPVITPEDPGIIVVSPEDQG